jgi:hypothetical protein
MPDPDPTPLPDPDPDPLAQVVVKRARTTALGPTGSSVRPAPFGGRMRAQAQEDRRAHLDAAFAYALRESEDMRPRVDVERVLAALDDADAWDAMDEQAEALTARIGALAEDAEAWASTAWIEHEALPDIEWASEEDTEVDVALDWERGVDTSSTKTYRRSRSASGSCEEAGASAPRTFQ